MSGLSFTIGLGLTRLYSGGSSGGGGAALIEDMLTGAADGEWVLAANTAWNSTNLGAEWMDETTFLPLVSSPNGTADATAGTGDAPYRSGPTQVLEAWNGMATDLANGVVYHYGGGHNSYAGNEVYSRSLATGIVTRLCDPTAMRDPRAELSPSATLGHGMVLSGGQPTGPLVGHTYHGLHIKDGILYMLTSSPFNFVGDAGYRWGFNGWQSGYGGDGYQQNALWKMDTTAGSPVWTRMNDFASFGTTASSHPCVLDHPTDDDLLVLIVGANTWHYKISTGAFQNHGAGLNLGLGLTYTVPAGTVDAPNERIYVLSSHSSATLGGFGVINTSAAWTFPNWQPTTLITTANFQTAINSIFGYSPSTTRIDEMGVAFDTDTESGDDRRILGMETGGHLFQIVTDGTAVGTVLEGVTTTGDVPTNQYGAAGNRCCDKFHYLPDSVVAGSALIYTDQRGLYAMRPPAIDDAGWGT